MQLLADLKFRMKSAEQAGPPEFQIRAEIRNGRLTNKMLPLPLHELTGKHYLSEPEHVEEVTLKKRKLQLKDRMEDILRHRRTLA